MPASPFLQPGSIQAFPSSQLCRSHISQCCPSLWEHREQGCATEVTKGGGQHPCRLSQKPHGGLWGFPSVVSPLPRELLARGSAVAAGRSCLGPWRFGLAAAGPCDAAALTSILCHRSAQGIKGRRGLCGEAAQQLLLGQNMKGFHFPCPLRPLASLPTAAREPWGCCAGSWWAVGAAAAPRVALSRVCELLLFWGAVLCYWQRLMVWGLLCPMAPGAQGLSVPWGGSCWHGGLVRGLLARAATGGQAGESVGATLMGSNAGCSSSSGIPLPRALAEMTSLIESPVCS